ncbi:MAG: O-antigen ligase family protein [Gemmatimonadaceae bacterium]
MQIRSLRLPEPSWRNVVIVLLLASLAVPLIVATDFFFPYVAPRNLFFRVVIEVGATALVLALCFGRKTLDLHAEPIFWSLMAFLGAAALSGILSPAPTHSFFGDFERMGGVWAWVHLVVFFLLLRTLRDQDWTLMLNAVLVVSLAVSIDAIAQRAGWVGHHTVSASTATIGNSGLLAPYLLITVAIAGYLASASVRYRLYYLAVAGVNSLALVYAQNRSTVIGLVLGLVVGSIIFALLATGSRKKWTTLAVAGALAVAVAGVTAAIRAFPTGPIARNVPTVLQRLATTNPAGQDESRAMQWRAAIEGFKDRPLLGYGLENHNLVWSAHFDPGIYGIATEIFDRTHNQYLETLATTGLIGAAAFLGLWVAIGVTLVGAYRAGRLSASAVAILAGLQVAYGTYLFFWFFDLNSTMLWILVAALISSRRAVGSVVLEMNTDDAVGMKPRPVVALASIVVLVAALYGEAWTPIRANLALAAIDTERGSLSQNFANLELLSNSGARQSAHTPILMAQFLGSLRPQLQEISRDSSQRRMLDRAFRESLVAFAKEIHRDTLNDRLYNHEGGLLVEAAHFYQSPSYQHLAIDAFHKAIDLSPHRIDQRIALASVYIGNRDYERALVVLSDAVKADPLVGEPRYRLAEAYLGAGRGDSALAMLQTSLRLGYVGAPETYLAVGKRLEFSGRSNTAANLYSDYLEAKYTEAVWDRSETIDRPVPTADIAVAAHLPLLYMRASESELAIKSAAALSAFDPSRTTLVDRFVSDVGSRRRANWVAKNSLLPCTTARRLRSSDAIAFGACGVFRRKL